MNSLARALDMTSPSKVDTVLHGAVEYSASFLGGMVQSGFGNPDIKGVPADLGVAGVLMLTGNPLARTIANGLTIGALGRFGSEFGRTINAARLSR